MRYPRSHHPLSSRASAQVAATVLEAFGSAKGREHAGPVPALAARCRPAVIVERIAAHPHHRVDRAAATDAPAAAVGILGAMPGAVRLHRIEPVEIAADLLDQRGHTDAQRPGIGSRL